MGGIGTATAQRASAFGFKLQYHNRSPVQGLETSFSTAAQVPKYVSFDELLETSDVISVHLPLGPATRKLISAKEIARMKKGVIIVNTARGLIIDENDLFNALEEGQVGSVGLDVYEKEPEVHAGLLKHPRAVLLPHIGTATVETQVRMLHEYLLRQEFVLTIDRKKWRSWLLIMSKASSRRELSSRQSPSYRYKSKSNLYTCYCRFIEHKLAYAMAKSSDLSTFVIAISVD